MRRQSPNRLIAQSSPSRIDQLERQVMIAKIMARRFWNALRARPGFNVAADELFHPEALRIVDPLFDAAEAIWDSTRILIEPCRRVFDAQTQAYRGVWPDGTERPLTVDQIYMMAGMDVPE